jgi:hypothetical protein
MKNDHDSKRTRGGSEYIPRLDDYELPAEYPFEIEKMKPNRFAGRVKLTRGRVRKGPGRKRSTQPVERHTITLFKSDVKRLKAIDPNLSHAVRKLLETTRG